MNLDLKDKSAIVTGSTAGIGLEIARKLAVEGAKVIITGRNKAKVHQAVDSIAGSGLDADLSARVAHAWDLAVVADEKEAKAAWDKALDKYKTQNEEGHIRVDSQQAQVLVRAFTKAYFISPAWQDAEAARRAYLAEASVVRADVVAAEGAAKKIPVHGTGDPNDALLTAIRDTALDPAQPTPLQKRLTQRLLQDTSARASGIWQEFNTKIATFSAAYREPATVSQFTETLLGQVADALQPEVTQTAAKQFEKVVSKGLKTALERSITTQFDRFLASLAGQMSVEAALDSVADATVRDTALTPHEIPEISKYVDDEALRVRGAVANPAFAEVAPIADDVGNMSRLAKTVHEAQLSRWENRGDRTSPPTMDFLATYEDYFANSEASAASTLRAKLLADSGYALKPAQFAEAAARARNFEKLTVFNRVGGVLIGRKSTSDTRIISPSALRPEQVLDGYSVHQESAAAGRIVLIVHNAAGQETRLGPYAPDIIYRALLFAADGRPLVVTIVNTGLGSVQKVILHPALVDTVIGCEMIELDNFVFSYIRKDLRDADRAEMQRVKDYDALYVLASLYGARAIVKAEFQPEFDGFIRNHIEDHTALQSALRDPLLFSDAKRSPLAASYRIYQKRVLDAMKTCSAKRPDNLESFGACIADAARTTTVSNIQAQEWLERPRALEFVSGVRDRPFALDADLAFLGGAAKSQVHNTLQFLIQDTDGTGDTNVWSFDSLTPSIEEGINALIQTDPQAAMILRNSEDFALLQRLFRLVFDGQLRGPQLLSQVATLARQLSTQINDAVSTPRWKSAQSPLGVNEARSMTDAYAAFAADAQSTALTPPEATAALTVLAGCADAAKSPERFASSAAWQTHCSFENVRERLASSCRVKPDVTALVCRLSNIAKFANATRAELEVAEMMGIPANSIPESTTPKACRASL